MLIAGNEVELMGLPTLVEMYGEESAYELLGRSFLKRMASKTVKVVKKAAPIVATGGLSKVLPKKIGRIVGKAAIAAGTGGVSLLPNKAIKAVATGGLSLVPRKILTTAATGGLNLVARPSLIKKAVRAAAPISRMAAHQVANVGRQVARSPLAMQALKAGISMVPGGGTALQAYSAASGLVGKGRQAARSFQAPAAQKKITSFIAPKPAPTKREPAKVRRERSQMPNSGPAYTPPPVASAPAESPAAIPAADKADLKMPLIIGGVGVAVLLGVMMMGKKK